MTGDTQGEFKGSPDWPLEGDIFIKNVKSTILRIRNHPSLLVWTGGNEGHARKELYDAHERKHYLPLMVQDLLFQVHQVLQNCLKDGTDHGRIICLQESIAVAHIHGKIPKIIITGQLPERTGYSRMKPECRHSHPTILCQRLFLTWFGIKTFLSL